MKMVWRIFFLLLLFFSIFFVISFSVSHTFTHIHLQLERVAVQMVHPVLVGFLTDSVLLLKSKPS